MRETKENIDMAVESVKRYIEDNYAEDLRIEDILDAGGITFSQYYFGELFKQRTGETMRDFIMHQRILAAVKLLETTKMSVLEIVVEVNFCAPYYFAKLFRKYMGCTPSEYRRKAGKTK